MFSGDAGFGQRSDIAADVDPPQRNAILAIQQIIMLAELPVDRGWIIWKILPAMHR